MGEYPNKRTCPPWVWPDRVRDTRRHVDEQVRLVRHVNDRGIVGDFRSVQRQVISAIIDTRAGLS
jgi:hypothetical protein